MKKTSVFLFIHGLIGLSCLSATAANPRIVAIGPEEHVGSLGRLCDIDVDTQDQPHLACDIGGRGAVQFYDRIRNSGGNYYWHGEYYVVPGTSKQFYNPRLEINNQNQAWISGVMWYPGGAGIVVRENVATAPVTTGFMSSNWKGRLPIANLSLDPRWPNMTAMYWTVGDWQMLQYVNNNWSVASEGSVGALHGGEKHDFFVSKAYAIHDKPGDAAWHFCTDWGYQSLARANNRKGILDWVSYNAYPEMGSDHLYPCVVGDHNISSSSFGDHTAYLAAAYRGIVMNIWRPTDAVGNGYFQFPINNLLTVDAQGHSGHARFEPQMCPANNGGTWIIYTRENAIWLCYVPKNTTSAADLVKFAVCPGSVGDVAVDSKGNLHIVYQNGGVKYRLLSVSGDENPALSDMAVFTPAFAGGGKRKLRRQNSDWILFSAAINSGKRNADARKKRAAAAEISATNGTHKADGF